LLKVGRKYVTLSEDPSAPMIKPGWILSCNRKILDKIRRENQNTHFMPRKYVVKSCYLRRSYEKYGRDTHTHTNTYYIFDHNVVQIKFDLHVG